MKKFLSKIMVFLILLTIIYIITAQTFRYLDLQVKGESGRMRYIHNELIATPSSWGRREPCITTTQTSWATIIMWEKTAWASSSAWADCNYSSKDACPHMLIYDVEPDYDLLQDDNSTISPTCAPITTDQAYERFSGTWTPPSASRCSFLSISIIRGYSSCLPTGVIQP